MATKKTATAVPRMTAQEKQWIAQDDLNVMRRAHEIQNDPKRMKAMQAEANKQAQVLQKVAGSKAKK
jgi:hypothetical protein